MEVTGEHWTVSGHYTAQSLPTLPTLHTEQTNITGLYYQRKVNYILSFRVGFGAPLEHYSVKGLIIFKNMLVVG